MLKNVQKLLKSLLIVSGNAQELLCESSIGF
jgi:hypothetical protein